MQNVIAVIVVGGLYFPPTSGSRYQPMPRDVVRVASGFARAECDELDVMVVFGVRKRVIVVKLWYFRWIVD